MLLKRPLTVDEKDWGAIYTLEFVDDVFPEHVHTDKDNHITIITHGGVKLLGQHAGKEIWAKPGGTIINWVAGEPHGFIALAEGTTLINILKNGR